MWAGAAGSVCSAVFLLLFPVAVQQDYPAMSMTYKCRDSVGIVMERFISGLGVKFLNRTVLMGQTISLPCVPTCPVRWGQGRWGGGQVGGSSDPGYIWCKDGAQLNARRTNSCSLTLNSVRFEDAGTYVCVPTGHENSSSSVVQLTVQRAPAHAVSGKPPDGTSPSDPPLTHPNDSKDQSFNYRWKFQSLYTLSVILLASAGVGLVVVMAVAFLMKKIKETEQKKNEKKEKKKKKKKKGRADSVRRPSGSGVQIYMSLDVPSQTAVYETVGSERLRPLAYSIYENSG